MDSSRQSLYDDLPEYDNHFRLLRIHPGERDDPIQSSLLTVPLTNPGCSYEALSYAWAESTNPRRIVVNNHEIEIRANLYEFFKRIRYPNKGRIVWVDAICIRQDALREKSHQVQIIGSIFLKAEAVLTWLGLEGGKSHDLMHLLSNASEARLKRTFENDGDIEQLKCAIINFLGRTYWSRTWIVQEFVLPHRIHLYSDDDNITEDQFMVGWRMLRVILAQSRLDNYPYSTSEVRQAEGATLSKLLKKDLTANYATVTLMQEYRARRKSKAEIFEQVERLLDSHGQSQCENPRDKVYALLSLVEPKDVRKTIQVDYEIDIVSLYYEVLSTPSAPCTIWRGLEWLKALGLTPDDLLEHSRVKKRRDSGVALNNHTDGRPLYKNLDQKIYVEITSRGQILAINPDISDGLIHIEKSTRSQSNSHLLIGATGTDRFIPHPDFDTDGDVWIPTVPVQKTFSLSESDLSMYHSMRQLSPSIGDEIYSVADNNSLCFTSIIERELKNEKHGQYNGHHFVLEDSIMSKNGEHIDTLQQLLGLEVEGLDHGRADEGIKRVLELNVEVWCALCATAWQKELKKPIM